MWFARVVYERDAWDERIDGLCASGGNVSIIGVYGPPWNLVDIGTAMNKGLTLRMNQCNVRRYMPHLLKHIREGRIDAKGIITHRFPLNDAPKAYRTFSDKKDGCVKCVLTPAAA